jgi:hypothetical protein
LRGFEHRIFTLEMTEIVQEKGIFLNFVVQFRKNGNILGRKWQKYSLK